MRISLLGVLVLLLVASCGGNSQQVQELETRISQLEQAATSTTSTTSVTVTSTTADTVASTPLTTLPKPTPPHLEMAWFWSSPDTESPLFRLLAFLTNPNDRPLTGVATHWEVYDASGALVGSHPKVFPALPPGTAFPYVGGAGSFNLTGTPATAEVFVDNPGQLADVVIDTFSVDDVAFRPEEGALDAPVEYLVTASITTGSQDVPGSSIIAVIILRDGSGNVVGADFAFPDTIPDLVKAGTTFRLEANFVPATASATDVEVFAYSEP